MDAYKNRISDISFTNKFVNLIVYYSCNKPISINCNKYIVSGVANILKIETSKINLVYSLYNDSDSDNTINIIYSGNEGNEDNIKIDNNILDDNVFDMITNSNKIQLTKKE
ncbi:hypothetical protein FACS189459_2730 [Bacilli bacterium]|nr:hypothetical protein FACS189459_2730 [Bacilli bacterium]GHU52269.1 hypothetical protein FACS189496_2140 [Bacilli bacterium]